MVTSATTGAPVAVRLEQSVASGTSPVTGVSTQRTTNNKKMFAVKFRNSWTNLNFIVKIYD